MMPQHPSTLAPGNRRRFVFPLNAPAVLTLPPGAAITGRQHSAPPTRRPPPLAQSGLIAGGMPGIDDLAIDLPEHLRISCILQDIANVIVVPPGIGFSSENIVFRVTFASPVTTSAESGYILDVPQPGTSLTYPGMELLFDGIVTGGCGLTPVVPLSVDSAITGLENEITVFAPFKATDDSTLKPNGFWTFNFVIRASTINGPGVSDFRIRGLIAVTCTNLASL
ncbi:MAG: hypothetical protein HC844_14230 [Tabrizicola sp.]|nr:hypothetical protein [Tabrizicola sp.]